jgi:hypothetical protein
MRSIELISPKTFNNHTTTQITTTAFKIDRIEPAMGTNVLTSHNRTPTTISTSNTWIKGITSPHWPQVGLAGTGPSLSSLALQQNMPGRGM